MNDFYYLYIPEFVLKYVTNLILIFLAKHISQMQRLKYEMSS